MSILSDEFYYQHINLDTVNTQVFTNLTSKVGDTNGRGLIVTLTENGLQKDTTGISLNLKWKHRSVVSQGLDNFDVVDLSKGIYKITYPTEMNRSGLVDAFVQIVDGTKIVGTRNMIISVESTVGDDSAIESSNSFTALASALIEVQSWNDRIDTVEQEFIDKANNLDATYPIELNSVKQQLEHIAKYITPEMFGAVGDGVTDDTNAIQAAMNNSESKFVLMGKEYLTSFTITIPSGKKVLGGVVFPLINIAFRQQTETEINGMVLDYSKYINPPSNANGYHGFYWEGVNHDIKVLNCEVKNFKTLNANRFNAVTSMRNSYNFKIDGLKVSNIRVRGNDIIGDEIGSVRAIYMGHEAYTSTSVPTLLRSGEISNIFMEELNNVTANDVIMVEDADGIYLSGYASDILLPFAKSNVSIRKVVANSTGKRGIKLQTSGVSLDNIEVNLTLSDPTTCAVMGYGYDLTVKNLRGKGISRLFEGLMTDSYFENISGECLYSFYLYSSGNSVLNKISIKSSNAPFFLNPTANSIYANYKGFTVENSELSYKHGLLAGTYYTDLNTIEGTFLFKNSKMTLLDGDYSLCYLRNINVEKCEYTNKRTTTASNLTFHYLYRGNNILKDITIKSETSIFPDIALNRVNNTKIHLERTKGVGLYNGYLFYTAGDIAEDIMIVDCDIKEHTVANPIFINLATEGTGLKYVVIKNVKLNDNATIRIGETTSTSLLNVLMEGIRIRENTVPDKSKLIASCVNRVSTLRTKNNLNAISGTSDVTNLISEGWEGLLYDANKAPYRLGFNGTTLEKVAL